MESVYDLTDSLYRQGWEHAESVDDYFYGDFPVLVSRDEAPGLRYDCDASLRREKSFYV